MFLKRLDIQGFKSFPEKIRLDFKKEIIGIVGPNGSGKSNISDAIRWVLGEQRAKNLRGDKMEDIIFSGTKNRKPLGFAEVTMYIDNKDKKLSLDYEEIAITRKVYRSGESGYYINGASCRLKDIYELFMDTGVGKEGYSIIGQGKIDAILSTKSEDRRQLFEEAVGIIKFKNRKVEAENKLEDIRKNLVRTSDIISELERQLEPLFEQKEKAKKFIEISNKLKIVRVNIFIEEYKNAEKNIKDILDNINILNDTQEALNENKRSYINNQQNLKENLLSKDEEIERLNKKILDVNIDIQKNESGINLDNQNIKFIINDIERIKKEKEKNNQAILKKEDNIKLIKVNDNAKNLEYTLKSEEIEKLNIKLKDITDKMDKVEEETRGINEKIVKNINLSSEIENKLSIYKISKENANKNLEKIEENIALLNSKIKEKTTRKMVIEKDFSHIKEKEENISKDINLYNLSFEKIKLELISIETISNEENKKYIELKNKHKILKELENDYEGYFSSVKAILKEKENNINLSGVCNVLGDVISVDTKYEIAIEIALGQAIQNIVTKTEEDAKKAILYLKENKKGRATFLPISAIKPKGLGKEKEDILKEKGIIGIADDLIKFDAMYKDILSNILGRTIIVDNIENGINFSKKYKYMYKIVTLDGELIHKGGALTGGSISKKTGGILSRAREIKSIFENISILEKNIDKNKHSIIKKQQEKNIIQKRIEEAREKLNNISLEKIKVEGEIIKANEYIKDLEESLKNYHKEKEDIKTKEEESHIDSYALEKQLVKINSEIEFLKKYVSTFKDKLEEDKIDKDTNFNYINKLKIEIKEIEYELQNNSKDKARLEEDIVHLKNDNNRLDEYIKENEEKHNILNENITNIKENIYSLKEKNVSLINKINDLHQEKIAINQEIDVISKDIIKISNNILDLQAKKTKLDLKRESTEKSIENFIDNMWNEYEITYASACNDYERLNLNFETLKNQENNYKKEISSLGNVNLNSIEEYKIIKDRYEFNIKQKDDIIKADDDLKDIIKNLVLGMENQFKEQFNLINKNFNKVFSDMFGGGKAELILSDKANILASGIDIVAQPPGKNLQSLTLLSGGERTLTAMSLLFAILMMKPSPFCILDEIEAALDDANVLRYAKFLKRFSKDNQFILITHKTGTMEIADVLYGVTMEEQGVSKVISVELKEAKEVVL